MQSGQGVAIPATVRAFESGGLALFCAAVSLRSASLHIVPSLTAILQDEWSSAWHSHVLGVNGALDHVPFAYLLEPKFRASHFPITLDQLAKEKIFGNAACAHSPHIAEPPKAPLCEKCVETAYVDSLQNLFIGDPLLPLNLRRHLMWKLLRFFSCLA